MTAPTQVARRVTHTDCRCGKRGWPTKFDADQVVVNAKILRHLHHNNRRREQRSYRCTTDANLWHVTSQEQREPGLRYAPDDDVRATEFIESMLLVEMIRNTDRVWEWLVAPEYVAQTERVLSVVHQDGLRDGADRKAALARTKKSWLAGGAPRQRYDAEYRAHQDWVLHWTRFQAALVARKAQARASRRHTNMARSANDAATANSHHRAVIARLACAVAEHRDHTAAPTAADRTLWAFLDALTVPYRGEDAPLASLIEQGAWSGDGPPRHQEVFEPGLSRKIGGEA